MTDSAGLSHSVALAMQTAARWWTTWGRSRRLVGEYGAAGNWNIEKSAPARGPDSILPEDRQCCMICVPISYRIVTHGK